MPKGNEARTGSASTVTNLTNTSNRIRSAGDAFDLNYELKVGDKKTSPSRDITGMTFDAKAVAVSVTDNDFNTALPLGTCSVVGSSDVLSTESNCPGTWAQHATVTLTTTIDNATNGELSVYVPKTLLKSVGFTEAPTPDSPLYVSYTVRRTDTSVALKPKIHHMTTNVIAFKSNNLFNIDET